MQLPDHFRDVFGVSAPYGRFQTEPAGHLIDGRNVILQAPTGSGKTKAALFPFLLARKEGGEFPRKLLYCVPMRVLARSFYDDLKNEQRADLDARLQTGEQQDDRRLEGEITFATIDQVLSSFLNIPYSLSLRQGNVNAGAVVSSYLVFDEFHLLDPSSTLPTTLEMLRMLKGVAPFLLMTATFSGTMLERLGTLLGAEVVTVSPAELQDIPTQKGKQRRFHRAEGPLTAEAVLARHRTRSIAICNTVERAQHLFQGLTDALDAQRNTDVEMILLHSRFLRADRREKEEKVRRFFGKEREKGGSIILVATQVVEVGLDVTCEILHTEVAPASSILQRAGRCARFENENGDVYVYQVPLNKKGEPNYGPYLGDQAALCEKTWDALFSLEGETVHFFAEQRLVDQVHAETDALMLNGLEQARYTHRQDMENAILGQEMGLARRLIRNDDSATLLVHPNPPEIENPYDLEGFSLFFGSLHARFKEWQESGLPNQEIPWLLQRPCEKGEAEDEHTLPRYEWSVVVDQGELSRSSIHVVNPLLVRYDENVGFRFEPGGSFQSPLAEGSSADSARQHRWGHHRESYQEHAWKTLKLYGDWLSKEMAYAAARLERQMGLGAGSVDLAARLAIALHDAGKMDRRWQDFAHQWQQRIGSPVAAECMLVHTDYDPYDPHHQAVEASIPATRPPHAVEGAVAVHRMIHRLLGSPTGVHDPRIKLMKAVFTAIARHHSPKADSYRQYDLHPAGEAALAAVLAELGCDPGYVGALERSGSPRPIVGFLVQPALGDALLVYFLIVRALRLADQGATGGKE